MSPPSAGSVQLNVMLVVDWASVVKIEGAAGTVSGIGMIAPLPSTDTVESPSELVAVTLTVTLAKSARLNGAARRAATGTEQVVAVLDSASQFVRSFSKVEVDVLISSL